MDQTIIENGNNVETYLYKKHITSSVENFRGQMDKKFATHGRIIGKGNYEFCVVDGKLVQVVPHELHKPLKRVISSLERDGLVNSQSSEVYQESAVESVFVAEEATM